MHNIWGSLDSEGKDKLLLVFDFERTLLKYLRKRLITGILPKDKMYLS